MCIFIPFLILSGWLQTKVLSRFVKMDDLAMEKAANVSEKKKRFHFIRI
jgi:hypothetical protein